MAMTSTVAVIADSAASLPAALARKWGITVVPLQIIVDDVSRPEGADVNSDSVLADLVAGKQVSTSQPNPAAFEEAFSAAADAGASGIVAVLISGKMSGTVGAAQAAAQAVSIPVTVVDSQTLAMATGYAALAAASAARAGGSVAKVAAVAAEVARTSTCVFTVDTLTYMQRGGRISPAVAAVGKMLSVRPVLAIVDGEVQVVDKVRTTAKARQAVLAQVSDAVGKMERPAAAIMALGDTEYGDDAARLFENRHPELAMLVRTPVSAVLTVHTGPGALAAVAADVPAGVV